MTLRQSVTVKAPQSRERDLRRHSRVSNTAPIQASWLDDVGEMRMGMARVVNISESGAALDMPEPPRQGSRVRIQSDRLGINGFGSVQHAREVAGRWVVGVEFLDGLRWKEPTSAAAAQKTTESPKSILLPVVEPIAGKYDPILPPIQPVPIRIELSEIGIGESDSDESIVLEGLACLEKAMEQDEAVDLEGAFELERAVGLYKAIEPEDTLVGGRTVERDEATESIEPIEILSAEEPTMEQVEPEETNPEKPDSEELNREELKSEMFSVEVIARTEPPREQEFTEELSVDAKADPVDLDSWNWNFDENP